MEYDDNEILDAFQSDYNREIEESFVNMLCDTEYLKLFFINENEAFTDGRNIIVDPALDEMYKDRTALYKAEEYLGCEHKLCEDKWLALKIVTRSQSIHESLHIIFTHFPLFCVNDVRSTTNARLKTLSLIANIIEDAFIEAAGCTYFDNIEFYLKFGRVSRLFASNPKEGTVKKAFHNDHMHDYKKSQNINNKSIGLKKHMVRSFKLKNKLSNIVDKLHKDKCELLMIYLDYMATDLLYPMVIQPAPIFAIRKYVNATKELFHSGMICGNPYERHKYVQKIFDIIENLIPKDDKNIDETILRQKLGAIKTHESKNDSPMDINSKGKEIKITKVLFGGSDNNNEQWKQIINKLNSEKENVLRLFFKKGEYEELYGSVFNDSRIHKDVKIKVIKPKINLNLKKAYNNIYKNYSININSYNAKFSAILRARVSGREERLQFGTGITSKYMGDVKKRYWYKNIERIDIPKLSLLLLIDGSGSMSGERCESARNTALILHEVLKNQKIKHSIVEHRASFDEPSITCNILIDFNGRDDQKYNVMKMKASGDNRDGLSLLWAEKYLKYNTSFDEHKLMIVVSDGVPLHTCEEAYYVPPVSIEDTKNAVKKILRRGTEIIAVALDDDNDSDEEGCYEELKLIYPSVVLCSDLKRLTSQIIHIIAKKFEV